MNMAAPVEIPQALEAARTFAERGWRPFPCKYMGKQPGVGIRWGTASASEPTDKTLEWWFGRDPVNIGISAKWSGLVFLDDDTGTADAMEKLCEAYGQPVPKTYRVRTSKGWHWYFGNPNGLKIRNAGQGSFLKDEFGFDVRGNCGGEKDTGGYVIAAGSIHESGHLYVAEDPDEEVVDLPRWLIELLEVNAAADREDAPEAPRTSEKPLDDRRFTEDQAVTYVQEQAINVLLDTEEGGRNNALNNAAVVVGHFLPEFWDEEWAIERLTQLAEEVGLSQEEIGPTIASGLRKGMSEPYTKVEAPDPFDRAGVSSEGEASAYEKELQRERIRRQVRAELDAEERPKLSRPFEDYGTWDLDLASVPLPEMAIGKLVPERGVGFLGGPSGSYKSFVAVSLGITLAYGGFAMDNPEFAVKRPRKVLYVAAEGSEGVALRTRAARHKAKITKEREFMVYRRAIDLTSKYDFANLVEFVLSHGFEFIIVDTFRQTTIGVNENANDEVGVVLARLIGLRDEHDIGSMLLDHTNKSAQGLADLGGAGAKRANSDYVLMVDLPGVSRTKDQQRTLRAAKMKDKVDGPTWPIKVETVPEVVDADGDPSAVVVVGEVQQGRFVRDHSWWMDEVPAQIAVKLMGKSGRTLALDMVRVLRHVAPDEGGVSSTRLHQLLMEKPDQKFAKSTFHNALGLIKNEEIAVVGDTNARVVIAPRWVPNQDQ